MDNQTATTVSGPLACIKRIEQATNNHDLNALADCFDPHYKSTFPAHPERAFQGRESMRRNWSGIFASVPDIHTTLIRYSISGDTIWSEWEWAGTKKGAPYLVRGVTIQEVPGDRVTSVRLYMEELEEGASPGIATQEFAETR